MPPKRKLTSRDDAPLAGADVYPLEPISIVTSGLPPVNVPDDLPSGSLRRSTRARKAVSYSQPDCVQEDDGNESPLTELEEDELDKDLVKAPAKKRRRKTKDNEPVVYDIPPVEIKSTTFKGRLGYACLNTLLRALKPDSVFCSRTCRKDTIHKNGLDFAKDLGRQNASDLYKLIEWNEQNNIKFLRVSSEMFPFASHAELGYDLEYAKDELRAAGDLAKRLGHRLTAHPGQFTQLASPKDNVVEASVRELEYHCQMMRYMGMGKDSIIIIHMGGVYGDKESTLARFKENYQAKLTDEMKARLVMENDEICYSVDDLLPVCNELDIPIVFDYHHNWINPSIHPVSTLIPMINGTWHKKGIKPKQHLSSPRPGAESVMEKRAHADRCFELPEDLPDDMDLMIEAKDKEQAVFHLYRIYDLHPVVHENLRPEKPPKPFVRTGQGDGGVGDGEDVSETIDCVQVKPRRGTRGKGKAKELVPNVEDDTLVGVPALVPSIATTKKKPRRTTAEKVSRGTKKGEAGYHEGSGGTDTTVATRMVNQEECVEPVDGGDVERVEEDEHPEVVAAAEQQQAKKGTAGKTKARKAKGNAKKAR
ncbi:unnamed protein product [Somion occarium]|uniref:UV-endonuclease UvdE n=1 Tax=Somion occarium TaxID=3059160 RepID=A0ABP1DSL8_9APHY